MILVSMAIHRDFLKFHSAFSVIPVCEITALCYTNLRKKAVCRRIGIIGSKMQVSDSWL